MQKIYCYVDETGQDTKGELFLVSVVIAKDERDNLIEKLEGIERSTGKGRVKWMRASDKARVAYIRRVLSTSAFRGKLHYASYRDTTNYLSLTILTTARAITASVVGEYKGNNFH